MQQSQDDYIPVKFAEIILQTLLKPQTDNTEAIKDLTKSINELIKIVSAPPSNYELQQYLLENKTVLLNKIDSCIEKIETELKKEDDVNTQKRKEALQELKDLFETNKTMISSQMDVFSSWCEDRENDIEARDSDILDNISDRGTLNKNVQKLLYWNKIVLAVISIAFTLITAAISFLSLVLK